MTEHTKNVGPTMPKDPDAILFVPMDADRPIVEEILQSAYDDVADEYERMDNDEMSEYVARKGSLCQELLGQLHAQD